MWRQFADDADAVLALISRQSDNLVKALERARMDIAASIAIIEAYAGDTALGARQTLEIIDTALRSRATSTEKKEDLGQ